MKRAIVLLLAIVYLYITSGVMVNVHYCMGEVASVNYGHEKDHGCDQCGMEQKDGCCHTEHQIIKSDDDHVPVKSVAAGNFGLSDARLVYFDEIVYDYSSPQKKYYSDYSPPGDHRWNELHVYNSVFRI